MIRLLIITLIINGAITMRGGAYKDMNQSNSVVSIWYYHEHSCSGAIIDDTHVLTAGHCVYGISKCILSVAAGIVERDNRNLQRIGVKEYYIHPNFREIQNPLNPNDLRWENDIAILEVTENVIWSWIVRPAQLLPKEFLWNTCSECKLFGWNHEIFNNRRLLSLCGVRIVILKEVFCANYPIHLCTNEKCVEIGFQNSIMEDGDRGSPLICDGYTVGIFVGGGVIEKDPLAVLAIRPYLGFIAETVHVGPIDVPLNDFQYFVSLWYFKRYRCGGTIIDTTHIVTAGHCVHSKERTGLAVIVGRDIIYSADKTLKFLPIKNIQIHPNFTRFYDAKNQTSVIHDIAILTLEIPLEWSAHIRPVPFGDALLDDQPLEVYRWMPQYTPRHALKSVHSYGPLMTRQNCRRLKVMVEVHQYCIKSLYSLPMAVPGNSGSSVIINGHLVGVIQGGWMKWIPSMGSISPVSFTSILPYLDWIKTTLNDKSS